MVPLLQGKKVQREPVVHHTYKGDFALRQGDWVFIDHETGDANTEPDWFRKERSVQPHNFPAELFNLKTDPQQTVNLYDQYPEKVDEMKKVLRRIKGSD